MIGIAFSFLRSVPAAWMAGALVLGMLAGWHALEKRKAYNEGWAAAIATVERMDARAGQVAREAQNAVDACFDQGGSWDAITASCRL
jgi:hypothetical protein